MVPIIQFPHPWQDWFSNVNQKASTASLNNLKLSSSSLTTLLTEKSHNWPLFSSESTLNSSHLLVLALTVLPGMPALISLFFPKRISLTTLRSLFFSVYRFPCMVLPHHFSQFVTYLLTCCDFPHYLVGSQNARPLLPHIPLYSQSLAEGPVDGRFSSTIYRIKQILNQS